MSLTAPVLFVLLWSSGYVVGAVGVGAAGPFALLSLRFVLATLLAVPLALRVPGWRRAPFRRLALIGLATQAVQFAGAYSGLALGVPPALSALVMLGLSPLASTAVAARLGLERPGRRTWAALTVGALGVAVSVAPELGDARVGLGVGLTVLGTLGLVAGTVLQRGAPPVDPRVSAAVQVGTAALVTVPITAAAGGLHLHASAPLAWSVAWLAWPLSVGIAVLMAHLLTLHHVSTVSALLLVVPAATTLLSFALLGQAPHPLAVVGMVVTAVAVGDVVRRPAASTGDDAPPARVAPGVPARPPVGGAPTAPTVPWTAAHRA
ncbi:DMT family transporter [Patulibacter sp. SYSU D01012]|uniref:DMT family transporter n=1 Tax=Patulibacter sp. SYSU D01012 TaxID=2817381 RepID=UPI001B3149CB|nr:DMT family transporter [Patulibacter sp. SYSU D01012]